MPANTDAIIPSSHPNETGFFPTDKLRDWLEGVLKKQMATKPGSDVGGKITFRQLYDATGIELNVVAANLSLKRQVIFSHLETPNCGVADAVVASSSIPFAFPSCLLIVPEDKDGGEERPNIIALPIPAGVTTLSFGMEPDKRRELLVEPARHATLKRLNEILPCLLDGGNI